MGSSAGCHSVHSHTTEGGEVSSSESELSHNEEDIAGEDENTEADKGGIKTSSDGQMASDGEEGQECPQTQDTLISISQIFGRHEDTDPESNPGEKIQPVQRKQCPKSPKEDSPLKASSESSSEQEPPTDEALRDEARQKAQLLDTRFDAWHHKKIAKGIVGWATRDTMICDLHENGKMQPNHPDPVGPPLDYMGECQVFDGIWSDIYDLCRFYTLGMTGDLPEFPTPQEPVTHRQIRDLLVSSLHWLTLPDPSTQHQLGDSRLYAEGTAHHCMLTTPPGRSPRQVGKAIVLPLLHLCGGTTCHTSITLS